MIENKYQSAMFNPFSRKTFDVQKELKDAADWLKIPLLSIDFDVASCRTLVTLPQNPEWIEADREMIEDLKKEQFLLNRDVGIRQEYEILIKPFSKDPNFFLDIELIGNKTFSKVAAIIRKSSIIKDATDLSNRAKDELNKKKLRHGMFIGIFDDEMQRDIDSFVSLFLLRNEIGNDYKISLCSCLDPVLSEEDKVIYHFKEKVQKIKEAQANLGKVDHPKRDFAIPVRQGELIIEYLKHKKGKPGRNCKGQYIEPTDISARNRPTFNIDGESILKQENDNGVYFVAAKSGVIEYKNNVYRVSDEIKLESIDFRHTGSIETGMDLGVTLKVEQTDLIEDSISAGVVVECSQIEIKGTVGSGAKVFAKSVKVDGLTHQNSIIESQFVEIKVHKGRVKADEVIIDTLEGGFIEARKVTIAKAIGGEVKAKEIDIKFCYSNVQLIAPNIINVHQIYGQGNKFIIDPEALDTVHDKIVDLRSKTLKHEIETKDIKKQYEIKSKLLSDNLDNIKTIKNKIVELEKANVAVSDTLKNRLRDYYELISETKKLNGLFKEKEKKQLELELELDKLQSIIFNSKIVFENPCPPINEVKFRLIFPAKEISHSPKPHERVFVLKEGVDDFTIKATAK